MIDPVTGMLVGSAITGALGYGASRSASKAANRQAAVAERAQRLMEEMIRKYEGLAEPFREALYPQLAAILRGDVSMQDTPLYRLLRMPAEEQYSQARSAIESGPLRGGARGAKLADLEAARASEVGDIPSKLYGQYMQTGLGIASGNPQLAVGGYGQIAQSTGPLIQAYTDQGTAGMNLMGATGEQFGSMLYEQMLKGQTPGVGTAMKSYYPQPNQAVTERYFPGSNLKLAYGGY